MRNRYVAADAAEAVRSLSAEHHVSELLASRTYSARLLGAESALVLHGGGNTSVKARATTLLGEAVDVLHVKGSGWDLATIEPAGHPAVRLAPLLAYRALASMTDEDMVNELRLNLLDASAPTPSVETLLHAFLPHRFVDHTHADAVLALADQADGERLCREAIAEELVWVPYVMPGFALAKRCAEAFERAVASGARPTVMVLERHGIFTMGDTAEESYRRMIEAVTRAEDAIAARRRPRATPATREGVSASADVVLPILRGVLARLAGLAEERGSIFELRRSAAIDAFLSREDAPELVATGCATPDHVIRTKPTALLLRARFDGDERAFARAVGEEVTTYAAAYDAYFAAACAEKSVVKKKLDPWPRVVLVPGIGVVAVGASRSEARIAADVYEHTISVMTDAADVGAYAPVSRGDLFDVEYWSLEQAKLKKVAERELAGRIALVTGAASGIGRATAATFLDRGAHVVLVDREASALEAAATELGRGRAWQLARAVADVTSWSDVEAAIRVAVETFGGLDVVVSNAGTAPEGRLDEAAGDEALRRSLDQNLLSHNLVARAATRVMKAQGRGGCLLFNASKSAFNQGPGFGPYAVAKAGLVALMRQYAVDLGSVAIRANAVNADRIRTALFANGVAESRSRARGVEVDEYFRANLLHREVTADDVARAFAYLAVARSTTGAVVTVDGGNAAAFPR